MVAIPLEYVKVIIGSYAIGVWCAIENWNVNHKLVTSHDLKTKVIEHSWKYETCVYTFCCYMSNLIVVALA
jgi:uncharacterized FAD-dependent dehydrogenase